jgi:hypothetical protein
VLRLLRLLRFGRRRSLSHERCVAPALLSMHGCQKEAACLKKPPASRSRPPQEAARLVDAQEVFMTMYSGVKHPQVTRTGACGHDRSHRVVVAAI